MTMCNAGVNPASIHAGCNAGVNPSQHTCGM